MSEKGKYLMRRGALMGPWGIGAIVPFPNDEIFMVAGLHKWDYRGSEDKFAIDDERLAHRLGVAELRYPPDFRQEGSYESRELTVPMVRFPRLYYCPKCCRIRRIRRDAINNPFCDECNRGQDAKGKKGVRMIPERFVVACPEGHISDIPVEDLIPGRESCEHPISRIRRVVVGHTAMVGAIKYRCEACGNNFSLGRLIGPGALERSGIRCSGERPWLDGESGGVCRAPADSLQVIIRGATNAWFGHVVSSIVIPDQDRSSQSRIAAVVNQYLKAIEVYPKSNGSVDRAFCDMLAEKVHVDKERFYQAVLEALGEKPETAERDGSDEELEYRLREYEVLSRSVDNDHLDFHSVSLPISSYDKCLGKFFSSISLVKSLKETRAFVGFSRITPPKSRTIAEERRQLSLNDENWLPAIQVYGEGVFFRFNRESLSGWEENPSVQKRIAILRKHYRNSFFNDSAREGELSPAFVLIHTFAHLLINQLSYECGYGSSALRERIYCDKLGNRPEMCGVLIYTASGDSEGSLGGLVKQGMPGRLEDTVVSAIKNASWCSSDPVCIQSAGQGPESLNLAACHNCCLLPETSCECGNRLLDRGFLVGTLEDEGIGFFEELVD